MDYLKLKAHNLLTALPTSQNYSHKIKLKYFLCILTCPHKFLEEIVFITVIIALKKCYWLNDLHYNS